MTISTGMKKALVIIGAVAVVMFIGIKILDAISGSPSYTAGALAEVNKKLKADLKKANDAIALDEKKIGELYGEIDSLNGVGVGIEEKLKQKDGTIAVLEEKAKTLTGYKEKYENSVLQITEWKGKFTFAMDGWINEKNITLDLKEIIKAKDDTILEYKTVIVPGYIDKVSALESNLRAVKWELTKARTVGLVKSTLVVAAGGYLLYQAVKPKA